MKKHLEQYDVTAEEGDPIGSMAAGIIKHYKRS